MSRMSQTPSRGVTSRVSTTRVTRTVSKTKVMLPTSASPIPGPSGKGRPRTAGGAPLASSSTIKSGGPGAIPKASAELKVEPPKEYSLPALSVSGKRPKQVQTELEKMKKKNVRRTVAEGEDPKMIKEVLKAMRNQEVLVQEFVAKIGPYTGDNGDCLRKVMADELSSFRKLATKVYETMTQDVSDVLTNEHTELTEFYREKSEHFSNKMTRCIDEIFDLCPNFDFEKYYSEQQEEYIESLFPVPEDVDVDPEELEMLKRQEMYHRLQWLRSEGERLAEENKRLQKRLAELKRQQKEGLRAVTEASHQAEERKRQLEQAEAQVEKQLEDLNESMEKTIVDHERSQNAQARARAAAAPKKGAKVKAAPRADWNVAAAVEIEGGAVEQTVKTEVSKVSMSVSKTGAAKKKPVKSKFQRPPPTKEGEAGGFHFSPIKTPPQKTSQVRERSPFHYSPPPDPSQASSSRQQGSPFHYSPPRTPKRPPPPKETIRVEATTVVTQEGAQGAARQLPRMGRRGGAPPRDSWGGFG